MISSSTVRRIALGFLVLALAVGVAVWWMTFPRPPSIAEGEAHPAAPSSPTRLDLLSTKPHSLAAPVLSAMEKTVSGGDSTQPIGTMALARRYAKSNELRAWIHESAKHIESGGLLAISAGIEDCFGNTIGRAGVPPSLLQNPPQIAEARALLSARCNIDHDEKQQVLLAVFSRDGFGVSKDPLMGAGLEYARSKKTREDSLKYLDLLMNSGFPAAGFSAVAMGSGAKHSEYYFDGKYFDSPSEQRLLLDAWQLVRCDLGDACGLDSTARLRLCADRGWCEATVNESLTKGYGAAPELASEFEALHRSLRAGFKGRELHKFFPDPANSVNGPG